MSKHEEGSLPTNTPLAPSPPELPTRGPNHIRAELTVFVGEFIGTFLFLFLAYAGTQIAITSATVNTGSSQDPSLAQEVSKLIYISFAFGAALAVNVSIFADLSGGMFNPAVTSALLLTGTVKWPRALHAIFAQLVASICSAFVVSAMLPGPLPSATTLEPSMSITRGLFLEVFLTSQLVLTILLMPNGPTKPVVIGLTLFVCEICGVYYTGGSLNPARSFGPAVVVGFPGYHWIYWVGPELGALLGSGAYMLVNTVKPLEVV